MRIALLHPFAWPQVRRGGERYAHDLAWWLARDGHRVDYVTTSAPPRRAGVEVADGVRLVRLPTRSHRRLAARGYGPMETFGLAVLPWLLRHRYDVVHALVPAAAVAAAGLRHRVVYTAIGHAAPLLAPGREMHRRMFVRAARAARVTTALSASAAAATEQVTGAPARVLPPGLRLDVFHPRLEPRTGPARVLFPADLGDPRKRLTSLLDAMPQVLDALPDARLVLAGPGPRPDGLDPRVAAAVEVAGVGALADVAERYRAATITALPSVDEAFGLVLAESMACGTPVVAVRSGSLPELVTPQVGRLAQPDEAADLATAIVDAVRLAADPATPGRCSDHAAQWGWDVVGPAHLAAYDVALA